MTSAAGPAAGAGLSALFNPAGIAVVGASPDLTRAGGRVFQYLIRNGYAKDVYPVNPRYDQISGYPCFPSVDDLPGTVDLVMVCVAAPNTPEVIRACGRRGVKIAVVHSDGFHGAGRQTLGDELRLAAREAGVRILGPNTNGVRIPGLGVLADASTGVALVDHISSPIALVTQSGGLGSYFGAIFLGERGVGPSYLVDTGNEFDIEAAECLSYLADDPDLDAIGLILESCRDGGRFVAAVDKAIAVGKKVLILKLATHGASAAAAASHTGAIAGRFDVFSQIVTRSGARICNRPRQFIDALAICGRGVIPRGRGVGVVTGSGGFGVVAMDLGAQFGLELPALSYPPSDELSEKLPLASFANPTDLSSQGADPAGAVAASAAFLAAQPGMDCVVAMQPHSLLSPRLRPLIMAGLEQAAADMSIPLFVCGMASEQTRRELWERGRISLYESPDDLFAALGLLVGGPPETGQGGTRGLAGADRGVSGVRAGHGPEPGTVVLVGREAQAALAGGGVEFAQEEPVASAEQARAFAQRVGRRIMLKMHVPGQAHKTELGLVAGPLDQNAIEDAYTTLRDRGREFGPAGIVAEVFEEGVEVAVGCFDDASFGRVVMVAAGGRLVELLDDVAFAAAPVSAAHARQMVEGLRAYRLLTGFRSSKRYDVDALVNFIVSFSELVSSGEFAFSQAELNPVIVRSEGHGVVAVDCVVVQAAAESDRLHG